MKLSDALKALPLIRFVLMLGGGVAGTVVAVIGGVWLALGQDFPHAENVWLARIQWVGALGMLFAAFGIVAMITLAWGKVTGLKVGNGAASVELDFDEDAKTTVTTTTEVQ